MRLKIYTALGHGFLFPLYDHAASFGVVMCSRMPTDEERISVPFFRRRK